MDRERRLSKYEIEIEELNCLTEQLNIEMELEPMMVSEAIGELKAFIQQNEEYDNLVTGFPDKKDNPYLEKAGCVLL